MVSRKGKRRIVPVFFLAGLVIPAALRADVLIKQLQHTGAFQVMGQSRPAKDETYVVWLGKDKARLDREEKTSIIVRLDKKVMYLLDHAEKTYVEMPADSTADILSAALSGAGLSEEDRIRAEQMMKGFAQMMKPEVTVTDTGETRKVKGWNCRKYLMKMKMMMTSATSEIWATEDIRIDYELFRALGISVMSQTPGLENMLEEMKKIRGIAVYSATTTSAMGSEIRSTQELIEVEEKDAPPRTYEIPEGYKKQEK